VIIAHAGEWRVGCKASRGDAERRRMLHAPGGSGGERDQRHAEQDLRDRQQACARRIKIEA
jgi:hypothetical protein